MTTYQAIGTSLLSPNGFSTQPSSQRLPSTDPSRLAPEDAFNAHSPPPRLRGKEAYSRVDGGYVDPDSMSVRSEGNVRRRRDKERGRSGSRKNNGVWKKLLWVKQSCTNALDLCIP